MHLAAVSRRAWLCDESAERRAAGEAGDGLAILIGGMSESARGNPVVEAYKAGVDRALIRERLSRRRPNGPRTSSRWCGSPRRSARPALPASTPVTDFAGLIRPPSPMAASVES